MQVQLQNQVAGRKKKRKKMQKLNKLKDFQIHNF